MESPNYGSNIIINAGTVTAISLGYDSYTGGAAIGGGNDYSNVLVNRGVDIYISPSDSVQCSLVAYVGATAATELLDGAPYTPGTTSKDLSSVLADYQYFYCYENEHAYIYAAAENVITATCANCGATATATITESDAQAATVTYSDNWQSGELNIVYNYGEKQGIVTASISVEESTASITYIAAQTGTLSVTATVDNEAAAGLTVKVAWSRAGVRYSETVTTGTDGTATLTDLYVYDTDDTPIVYSVSAAETDGAAAAFVGAASVLSAGSTTEVLVYSSSAGYEEATTEVTTAAATETESTTEAAEEAEETTTEATEEAEETTTEAAEENTTAAEAATDEAETTTTATTEAAEEAEETTTEATEKTESDGDTADSSVPNTGDDFNAALWFGLLGISLAGLIFVLRYKNKKTIKE
ncbi:MAG: LPXTG cell wall anchor domain-containing protein [Clostridiales bacterium]|nr:LPXTG cell wall anchor domain-containing protein [Clostridiales bacterium]